MDKRNVVESKSVIVFDRAVKASEINELTKDFYGDVIVTKKIVMDKGIDITCNLYVIGGIVRKYPISESNININGDFYCYGEMHCHNINVSGCFYSKKIVYSKNIRIGEDFLCDDKVDAYGCSIIVVGNFECYDIIAKSVECLEKIRIHGSANVTDGLMNK